MSRIYFKKHALYFGKVFIICLMVSEKVAFKTDLRNLNYNINLDRFELKKHMQHVEQSHNTLVAEHSKY